MPPLTIMIKPASSLCNLACNYCFYHSLADARAVKSYGIMKLEVIENIVKKAYDYAENIIFFNFQGGEPLLAGLEFFEYFVECVKKYNKSNTETHMILQTNATLINPNWISFFKKNNFLLGISLDGPEYIHDKMRKNIQNKGTFKQVIENIEIIKENKVNFNILSVVNSIVSENPEETYNFFKYKGFKYIQFIPCIEPLHDNSEYSNNVFSYSLEPLKYEFFLKKIFDLWYDDLSKNNYISIRNFDNYVMIINGYNPELCAMRGKCPIYFLIESGGQSFPCDFYALDKYYLGNILESSFHELATCQTMRYFIRDSENLIPSCIKCKWFFICKGGCRRDREPIDDNLYPINRFCQTYKNFFYYAYDRLKLIKYK